MFDGYPKIQFEQENKNTCLISFLYKVMNWCFKSIQ